MGTRTLRPSFSDTAKWVRPTCTFVARTELTAEVVTPSLPELSLVETDKTVDAGDLHRIVPVAPGKTHRLQPELRIPVARLHVDVYRLFDVIAPEEKPVRTGAQHGGHRRKVRIITYRPVTAGLIASAARLAATRLKECVLEPRDVVQPAIDAYHDHDLDRCLSFYAPEVVVRDADGKVLMEGSESVRTRYAKSITDHPNLHYDIPH